MVHIYDLNTIGAFAPRVVMGSHGLCTLQMCLRPTYRLCHSNNLVTGTENPGMSAFAVSVPRSVMVWTSPLGW